MSYSARCRNLPTKNAREELLRHAAAEIAAEADQEIAEARRCVAEAMERERLAANDCADAQARLEVAQRMAEALRAVDTYPSTIAAWQEARAALAEWEKQQ